MKQYLRLCVCLAASATLLFPCQVQGGIITNQQSLTLPAEIVDAITSSSSTSSSSSSSSASSSPSSTPSPDDKNATRTGRVIYTAPYSNVRIASKEPKNLKYFPIPAVVSKKTVNPATNYVPFLPKSTSTTTTSTEPSSSATTTTTVPSTTTTTTSSTPEPESEESDSDPQPLPDEVPSEKDLDELVQVGPNIPDIIEIMEEVQGRGGDAGEVVTEMINEAVVPSSDSETSDSVTETNLE